MAQKILSTALVVGVAGAVAGAATYSAFSATATNDGNTFAAGTVVLGDNDAGGAVLSLDNAKPGDTSVGCIRVIASGSLESTVRMYAAVTGTLGPYLTLTVTRGTDASPSFKSCQGFSPDDADYGLGAPGRIFSGPLSSFPSDWGTGVADPPSGTPEVWTTDEAHSYRFHITLQDDNAAQGRSSTVTFTWEARNT
ncbi:MAG: CalY family protein [Actinomycetota bacterium]|nr:CalY family protein [Actinomycetota bacterium]